MFLSKRKNGFYYIVYKNHKGNKTLKSTGTKRKSEAYAFLNQFRITTAETKTDIIKIDLRLFASKFMSYSEAYHSPLTARDYTLTFKKLLLFFGNLSLDQITGEILQSYITERIRTGSLHQARKDLINIKAAFNWAVKEKYLLSNPSEHIKRIKIPEKLPVFFHKYEFEQLLMVIDNEDIKDLVIVAVNTGMRQGELITLQWRSIHLEQRLIILDNTYFLNKSRKVRSIPINDNIYELLLRRKRTTSTDLVFTYLSKPIKQDLIVHKFKKYIRKASLRKELRFHSLRHSFATWLVQRGASIYQVSKLLGHADVTTTQIYAHLVTDDLKAVVRLLN